MNDRKRYLARAMLVLLCTSLPACNSMHTLPKAKLPPPANARAGQYFSEPCDYSVAGQRYRAECGGIFVPERRSHGAARLITLPFTRVHGRQGSELPPVFYLGGGPGMTNLNFKPSAALLERHDVVMVGYRGVDGSARLDCPEIRQVISDTSEPLSEPGIRAMRTSIDACFTRLAREGYDLAGYTVPEIIHDLEDVRSALGYPRISLLSESFGTRVALLYGSEHPEQLARSVLIGANPPGGFVWEPALVDEKVRQYSGRYAAAEGTSADALVQTLLRVRHDMPKRWGPWRIDADKARISAFVMLFHCSTSKYVFDAYRVAESGDASGLAVLSKAFDVRMPGMFVWGDFILKAVTSDFDPQRDYARELDPPDAILGSPVARYFFAAIPARHVVPVDPRYRTLREATSPPSC